MTSDTQLIIKVIAGTVLFISLVIGFFERWYRPSHLLLEQSRSLPSWAGWLGCGFGAVAALTYVVVDFIEWGGA